MLAALKEKACCPILEELDLSCLEITPELCAEVVEVVAAKPKLRELRLAENELASEGACTLAACVAAGGSLRKLDLRENQIGGSGALALGRAVAKRIAAAERPAEEEGREEGGWCLELDSNQVSEVAVEKLRTVLSEPSLEMLGSMEENEPDMDEDEAEDEEGGDASGADDLADVLGGLSLKA